jgi:cation:H+ antiporter
VVLVANYVGYTIRVSKAPAGEPHLVGPAAWIATFGVWRRRTTVMGLFVAACLVILLCAEHFASALVDTGKQFGVNEFLLVQWLAPLASEAPELIVAGLYAYRLNVSNGLGALVSSKVNQWTLLVGTLPVVFAITSHSLHGLPIISLQREELLITAAQSVFAVAVLASMTLSRRECHLLLGLFVFQFTLSAVGSPRFHDEILTATSAVYLVLAAGVLARDRHRLAKLFRDGFATPYAELVGTKTTSDVADAH